MFFCLFLGNNSLKKDLKLCLGKELLLALMIISISF
jgi:hypothetical protein